MSEIKIQTPNAPAGHGTVKPVKFIHRKDGRVPTYQADGAWGGINQFGMLRFSFYTESPPVPTSVIQPVDSEGRPKGEPRFEGADDSEYFLVVRDYQCDVILTLASAAQLHQVLGNCIQIVQQQMKDQIQDIQQRMESASVKTEPKK